VLCVGGPRERFGKTLERALPPLGTGVGVVRGEPHEYFARVGLHDAHGGIGHQPAEHPGAEPVGAFSHVDGGDPGS